MHLYVEKAILLLAEKNQIVSNSKQLLCTADSTNLKATLRNICTNALLGQKQLPNCQQEFNKKRGNPKRFTNTQTKILQNTAH